MHESKLLESGYNLVGNRRGRSKNTYLRSKRCVCGSSYLGGFIDSTDGSSFPGYRDENEELRKEWAQEISG